MTFFRYILLFVLIGVNAQASKLRKFEDFEGDALVIGKGKHPYYRGIGTIDPKTEYSIDIFRRVLPDMKANGLCPSTYTKFPDSRFQSIDFFHVGCSPLILPELYSKDGKWIKQGYKEGLWQADDADIYCLPDQLNRILKKGGVLTYRTFVLGEYNPHFSNWQLMPETNANKGLLFWEDIFSQCGFSNIQFRYKKQDCLNGFYIEMTAVKCLESKPKKLKRTPTVPIAGMF